MAALRLPARGVYPAIDAADVVLLLDAVHDCAFVVDPRRSTPLTRRSANSRKPEDR